MSCPIVGVGGSAGGFEAAMELLRHLPPKTGMAFVIVQHLDPHHASQLPKLFSKATAMPVIELAKTTTPRPDAVYVQPANKCVIVKDGALKLVRRTQRLNLAIDHFFESLAIAILETLDQRGSKMNIRIFGTDLSESTIEHARAGIYSSAIEKDVSRSRLRRFFSKRDGAYQINRKVRDLCTFGVKTSPPIRPFRDWT